MSLTGGSPCQSRNGDRPANPFVQAEVQSPTGGGPDFSLTRRSSPLRFFHAILFVMGGGLALFWSRWGLILIAV